MWDFALVYQAFIYIPIHLPLVSCACFTSQAQGINERSLFWTWKMPYGGSHEDAWSVQNYFRKNFGEVKSE